MLALTMCPLRLPQGRQSHRSAVRLQHDGDDAPLRDVSQAHRAAVPSLPRRRALCAAAGLALAAGPASQATASQAVGSAAKHGQSVLASQQPMRPTSLQKPAHPLRRAALCLSGACPTPPITASATQVVIGAVQARPGKGPEDMLVWKSASSSASSSCSAAEARIT